LNAGKLQPLPNLIGSRQRCPCLEKARADLSAGGRRVINDLYPMGKAFLGTDEKTIQGKA